MPKRPCVELPPQEYRQILAALRRARSGDLLARHLLLWCAAGRAPTDIAVVLFCSRSSVVPHGTRLSPGPPGLGTRRPRAASSTPTYHGAGPDAAPVARIAAQG